MTSRIFGFVMAGWLFFLCPVRAQDRDDVAARAMDYLTTLYSFDFEKLEGMIAADAVLRDPTAVALRGRPLHYVGRDSILSSFRTSAVNSRNAGFEVERQFSTGQFVTVTLVYHTEIKGDAVGIPHSWIPIRVQGVTIIRVVDGKIQEHVDYVDYDELLKQIARARQTRSELRNPDWMQRSY